MGNISEREAAELIIEKWLFDNIGTEARMTVDASRSGGYNLSIFNSGSFVTSTWGDCLENGIQDIAELIADMEAS